MSSVLSRVRAGIGRRDSLAYPSEDLIAALTGQNVYAGKHVTVQSALTLIPVWRAVSLRAGAVGSSPLEVFKHTSATSKEIVSPTSRPWQLLHDKPNEYMTAVEVWKMVEAHLCTWGNAFLWKERGTDGRIANLWPISPRRVQVGRGNTGRPVFLVDTYAPTPPGQAFFNYGSAVYVDDSELLHIRGLGEDGLVGYSPIQLARQALGAGLAQQEYEGRSWANDGTPGVTLLHPNKLTPEGVERLRALWDGRHRGPDKARRTAVLGEGVKIDTSARLPMADMQFVQIAGLRRADIALLFGIPPYKLAADAGHSMTYSNSETESLDFVKWSLRDSMTTIESAITWDPDIMPQNWFCKFCADDILRGAQQERYTAYSVAPHLLVDDIRVMEDMAPLPDGKGQVLAKTIGPPRTTIPVQDEPLADQPTPGPGESPGVTPTPPAPTTEPAPAPAKKEPKK